jgi:hypothetical protein
MNDSFVSKKLEKGQILVASDKRSNGKSYYRFWEVIRSTTNTCEIIELRIQILRQIGDTQEICPYFKNYVCENATRFKVRGKLVLIDNYLNAIPWDGKSRFQQALIYFAD